MTALKQEALAVELDVLLNNLQEKEPSGNTSAIGYSSVLQCLV